tara:strand:+ start:897 stop:1280 length:384 start_codon:yes stop_codon:yes gene_type:complete
MRLTTAQKNSYKRFLIDCIAEPSEYGITNDNLLEDTVFKVQTFFKVFNDEYGYEITRQGEYNALTEYMQNQPSSISLPCYYHEQIELAKELGSIPQDATDKQEQKIIDNFYNFFTNYLLQLKRTMKI